MRDFSVFNAALLYINVLTCKYVLTLTFVAIASWTTNTFVTIAISYTFTMVCTRIRTTFVDFGK